MSGDGRGYPPAYGDVPRHFGRGGGARSYSYGRGGEGGRGRGRGGRGGGRGRGRGSNSNNYRGGGGRGGGRGRGGGGNYPDIQEKGSPSESTVTIAIEGCGHGELDRIYERLQKHEEKSGRKIDLLLCCGDFQSLRNFADFHSIAVPPKYRSLGSFYRYYSGEVKAPILTVFVGGNHEASQPLQELGFGGWVAPNIYYMGFAGVLNFNGIRIGGLSGIFKQPDYRLGRFERPPYDRSSKRSIYHVRSMDIYRMKCLSSASQNRIDVFLSHDWPLGIEQHGDTANLLRCKPFFRSEVEANTLGSPPNREILDHLRPKYWFAAHLHVKFEAKLRHPVDTFLNSKTSATGTTEAALIPSQLLGGGKPKATSTGEEKVKGEGQGEGKAETTQFVAPDPAKNTCSVPDLTEQMTQFLSLDKCLPRRHALSIVHIPVQNKRPDPKLEFDLEWLAILKKTHRLTSTSKCIVDIPSQLLEEDRATEENMEWIRTRLQGSIEIPCDFVPTVPHHASRETRPPQRMPPPFPIMGNPQTDRLLQLLDIPHVFTVPYEPSLMGREGASGTCKAPVRDIRNDHEATLFDENEIDLEDVAALESLETQPKITAVGPATSIQDDNEIDLDEESGQQTLNLPEESIGLSEESSKKARLT